MYTVIFKPDLLLSSQLRYTEQTNQKKVKALTVLFIYYD